MKSLLATVAGVISLAFLFGFVGSLIVQTSGSVVAGVGAIEGTFQSSGNEGALNLIEDGTSNEFAAGIGMVLRGVLFAGLPCGILAVILRWRYRAQSAVWSGRWSEVFLAGYVLQVCNLCLVILLLTWLLAGVGNPLRSVWAIVVALALVANAVISAAGTACWHSLRTRVTRDMPSLVV